MAHKNYITSREYKILLRILEAVADNIELTDLAIWMNYEGSQDKLDSELTEVLQVLKYQVDQPLG